jgi:hypothetical protein
MTTFTTQDRESIGSFCETHQVAYTADECPRCFIQSFAPTVNHDPVNHPKHYTNHPSGVECIQITEHMGFNLGNAIKYIWRSDLKNDAIEDLKKAVWYVQREIDKREKK